MKTMVVEGLRVEDRLPGAGNWSPWKARIVLILEEGELWDIVENPVVTPIDVVLMAEFRKRNIKAKRTILDVLKDHVVLHVSSKDFAFQMWGFLCGLYQSPNQNRKMVLQEKLRATKMMKTDTVTSLLTRFSHICNELEAVYPLELVWTTLNDFSKPWESFV
jgi:RNAse (barnase) inhibitor barstar